MEAFRGVGETSTLAASQQLPLSVSLMRDYHQDSASVCSSSRGGAAGPPAAAEAEFNSDSFKNDFPTYKLDRNTVVDTSMKWEGYSFGPVSSSKPTPPPVNNLLPQPVARIVHPRSRTRGTPTARQDEEERRRNYSSNEHNNCERVGTRL